MMRIQNDRASWLAQNILPHEGALRGWLASRRVEDLEIDDVVQEAYAKLASLESVEGVRNSRAYLFQTAHSILCSHLRRSQIVSIKAVDDAELRDFWSESPSPESAACDRDELDRIGDIVSRFPKQVAAVFVLRKVEGLSQRETAQRLNVSESTVEKHMAKGLRLFMDSLARSGIPSRGASRRRKAGLTSTDGQSQGQCGD